MSKKFQWALVIAIATAGIGAGSVYAATNGSDAFGLGKHTISQNTASVKQHMRGAIKISAPMMDNTELLSLLKLDKQTLKEKRDAGQSLAEIAEAQGVTRQQLIDFLTKQNETRLAQEVKNGKIQQEQADQMKQHFPQMVEKMIDDKGHGDFKGHGGGKDMFFIAKKNDAELLALLKLDKQALNEKRKAGQSLAEIAAAQGVTRQQLIDFLTKQNETELAKAVADGKIKQEQADKMKEHFPQMVEKMIDAKPGDRKAVMRFEDRGPSKSMFQMPAAKTNAETTAPDA